MRRDSHDSNVGEPEFFNPQRRHAVTSSRMMWKDVPLMSLFERADGRKVAQFLQAFTEYHAKKTLHSPFPFPGVTQQVPLCEAGSVSFPALPTHWIELQVLEIFSLREDVSLRDIVMLGEVCPAMYCNIKELLQECVECFSQRPSAAVVADRETVSWLRDARLHYRPSEDNKELAWSLPRTEDEQSERKETDKEDHVSVKLG